MSRDSSEVDLVSMVRLVAQGGCDLYGIVGLVVAILVVDVASVDLGLCVSFVPRLAFSVVAFGVVVEGRWMA